MFVRHLRPYRPVELIQPSHVILGGGVAVCLLLSAHRAVILCDSTAFLESDLLRESERGYLKDATRYIYIVHFGSDSISWSRSDWIAPLA